MLNLHDKIQFSIEEEMEQLEKSCVGVCPTSQKTSVRDV
jgi:hypothetical protein